MNRRFRWSKGNISLIVRVLTKKSLHFKLNFSRTMFQIPLSVPDLDASLHWVSTDKIYLKFRLNLQKLWFFPWDSCINSHKVMVTLIGLSVTDRYVGYISVTTSVTVSYGPFVTDIEVGPCNRHVSYTKSCNGYGTSLGLVIITRKTETWISHDPERDFPLPALILTPICKGYMADITILGSAKWRKKYTTNAVWR